MIRRRRGRRWWRVNRLVVALAPSLVGGPQHLVAQVPLPVPPPGSTVTVPPGAHYRAGGLYRAFMGSGYRDLWTTPIRVPVADLATYAGGLTPVRVGGGMTTKTLHLDGADGRRYVFRSVDKDPVDLVEEFVGTPIEAILRDQMSSFHPSGAVVVARILDAVGVLHVTPQLVVVPDDPALGEFRAQFAGMLALFEERPDDAPEGAPGFAGSRRIVQTDDLFTILEEDPRNHVATRELLTSRLVDLLVGDRDRSTNNHLWARFEDPGGGYVWRPIPRDRDQAFVQLDGVLKSLGRTYDPRLVHFGDDYPSVAGLTRNAWDIDRNFLSGMSRDDWLQTVQEVKRLVTDSVIDIAVHALPAEHFAIAGPSMIRALVHRRDHLDEAAERFYDIVFGYADIQGTDADEVAMLERRDDGSVRVTLSPTEPQGARAFDRTFTPDETHEVRLYLHGGDDVATVTGEGPGSIKIRVVGGGGEDRLVDSSTTGPRANEFYDAGGQTVVVAGPGTRFHARGAARPFSWFEDQRTLDWGHSWVPEPRFGYDADRGLVLTAGMTYNRYGFLRTPYATRTRLRAGWSFALSAPVFDVRQYLRGALGSLDLRLRARWSGMEIIHFYGFGNESPALGPVAYHLVPHKQLLLSAQVGFGDGQDRQVSLGPVLQYLTTDTTTASTYLGTTKPYGSGRFGQLGLQATVTLDGRDRTGTPSRGYVLDGGATLFPDLVSVTRGDVGEIHGQGSVYLSPKGGNPTLALRAQGKKVWGAYPFAEAAFLGGASSLRGVPEQRFAGDASLLGSAELRIFLARLLFIVPSDFGVYALTDRGRVFHEGESSGAWHSSFGGGLWLAPLGRTSALHVTVVRAEGRTSFYTGIGFAY